MKLEKEERRKIMEIVIENLISKKKTDSIPKNVKCNCGHTQKDHYRGGWCHSSGHPKEGQCGCTYYYPNDKWILKNKNRGKRK